MWGKVCLVNVRKGKVIQAKSLSENKGWSLTSAGPFGGPAYTAAPTCGIGP